MKQYSSIKVFYDKYKDDANIINAYYRIVSLAINLIKLSILCVRYAGNYIKIGKRAEESEIVDYIKNLRTVLSFILENPWL